MINYFMFRHNAMQSLSLLSNEDKKSLTSKEAIEKWIKSEYKRQQLAEENKHELH